MSTFGTSDANRAEACHLLEACYGTVAVLTLNRPSSLNSLTIPLMADLLAAVRRAEANSQVRALVLTGAGRGFCSGQDLSDRLPAGTDIEQVLMATYYPTIAGLRGCRLPVVMAVNGVAAGAGFSLAMAGDFLIASSSARFIQAFSRIGLVPDLGSTYLLPRAVGRARALRLMMTGEPLSGAVAYDWGLAIECVQPSHLLQRSIEFAEQLGKGPLEALRETRRLVEAGEHTEFDKQFRTELAVQSRMRCTPDALEGVQAFLAKREPMFTDR